MSIKWIWDSGSTPSGTTFNPDIILTGPSEDLWAGTSTDHLEVLVDELGRVLTQEVS